MTLLLSVALLAPIGIVSQQEVAQTVAARTRPGLPPRNDPEDPSGSLRGARQARMGREGGRPPEGDAAPRRSRALRRALAARRPSRRRAQRRRSRPSRARLAQLADRLRALRRRPVRDRRRSGLRPGGGEARRLARRPTDRRGDRPRPPVPRCGQRLGAEGAPGDHPGFPVPPPRARVETRDPFASLLGIEEGSKTETIALAPPEPGPPAFLTGIPSTWGSGSPKAERLADRHPDRNYWFEPLPERKAVYFRFASVQNEEDEPLVEFCPRMFAEIASRKAERLVIDLRGNNGGNNYLTQALVHGVIKSSSTVRAGCSSSPMAGRSPRRGTARATSSATWALFVGSPTGGRPNHFGDAEQFSLPESGICSSARRPCAGRTRPARHAALDRARPSRGDDVRRLDRGS